MKRIRPLKIISASGAGIRAAFMPGDFKGLVHHSPTDYTVSKDECCLCHPNGDTGLVCADHVDKAAAYDALHIRMREIEGEIRRVRDARRRIEATSQSIEGVLNGSVADVLDILLRELFDPELAKEATAKAALEEFLRTAELTHWRR